MILLKIKVFSNTFFYFTFAEFRSDTVNPCNRTYAGREAFSEPESLALRNVIHDYKPVAYLTIHSFGGVGIFYLKILKKINIFTPL